MSCADNSPRGQAQFCGRLGHDHEFLIDRCCAGEVSLDVGLLQVAAVAGADLDVQGTLDRGLESVHTIFGQTAVNSGRLPRRVASLDWIAGHADEDPVLRARLLRRGAVWLRHRGGDKRRRDGRLRAWATRG
jgi:hypothetical protein